MYFTHPRHVAARGAEDMEEQCVERCVRRIRRLRQSDRRRTRFLPDEKETAQVLLMEQHEGTHRSRAIGLRR